MTKPVRGETRVAVVVITYNRCDRVLTTLERLGQLPEAPRVIVVDNGSTDGTAARIKERFPGVDVLDAGRNLGAAARNLGVRHADTPYVAFCDDDTHWAPGSLSRAADLFDANSKLALLCARVRVGIDGPEDPTCAVMAASRLPREPAMPGPPILGFLAGATIVRRSAFLAAGGFEPRFFVGGEEELLAADIAAQGGWLCYVPDLLVYHEPHPHRDSAARRRTMIRNALWFAWLRRPWAGALRKTLRLLRDQSSPRIALAGLTEALRGLPWVLKQRRVVPSDLEHHLRLLEGGA